MKHRISFAGILLLSLLVPAQASANPTVSKKDRMALVEKGKSHAQAERYPEALEALSEALEISKDAKVLLWMGYVQEQMGQLLQAKETYLEASSIAHASKLAREERNA